MVMARAPGGRRGGGVTGCRAVTVSSADRLPSTRTRSTLNLWILMSRHRGLKRTAAVHRWHAAPPPPSNRRGRTGWRDVRGRVVGAALTGTRTVWGGTGVAAPAPVRRPGPDAARGVAEEHASVRGGPDIEASPTLDLVPRARRRRGSRDRGRCVAPRREAASDDAPSAGGAGHPGGRPASRGARCARCRGPGSGQTAVRVG